MGSTPHLGEAQVGLALQQFPEELTCPQVHCISTEFTLRKHGGEKGVPFRVQIDTFRENESGEYTEHLHSASCQIKVFKVPAGPSHLHSPVTCPSLCWGLLAPLKPPTFRNDSPHLVVQVMRGAGRGRSCCGHTSGYL